MKNSISTMAALTLAFCIGVTASAQQADKGRSSDSRSDQARQAQGSGQTATVCGEIAGVSVVGETVIEPASGRGIVAELTYLTILGSPSGADKHNDEGAQASNGRDEKKPDHRPYSDSQADRKDQNSTKDKAGGDRKDHHGSSAGSDNRRRQVYQIAVGPKTDVCSRCERGHESGEKSASRDRSSAESSQAHIEILELGDRVEVEFTRVSGQGDSGSGGAGQVNGAHSNRHGRHRIVHGVASKITILSDSCQACDGKSDSKPEKGGSKPDKRGSSGGQDSGSGSREKGSDRSK